MAPFKSLAQEKWAFATHQPWARKWAAMTDQKSLTTELAKRRLAKKKKKK